MDGALLSSTRYLLSSTCSLLSSTYQLLSSTCSLLSSTDGLLSSTCSLLLMARNRVKRYEILYIVTFLLTIQSLTPLAAINVIQLWVLFYIIIMVLDVLR